MWNTLCKLRTDVPCPLIEHDNSRVLIITLSNAVNMWVKLSDGNTHLTVKALDTLVMVKFSNQDTHLTVHALDTGLRITNRCTLAFD